MTEPALARDDLLDAVTGATRLIAEIISSADPSLEVATCPGWDLRRLAVHVGTVHRWATEAASRGEAPTTRPADPDPSTPLGPWLTEGAHRLVTTLATLDPAAPSWHPFTTSPVAAFWPRRMAHETVLHRIDAQLAVGQAPTDPATAIDPVLASDTVDEYFEVMLPAALQRRGRTLPGSTLHVHCTDVAGEWLVWASGSALEMQREHAKGDAALRGPASALALALWARPWPGAHGGPAGVDIVGDTEAAAAWLALGGA